MVGDTPSWSGSRSPQPPQNTAEARFSALHVWYDDSLRN